MEDYKGILKLIVIVLAIAATVLGPVIERWLRRSAEQKGEPPPSPNPEPEGPKLPYEDLAEEVFGPYIERRRRAKKAPPPPPAFVEAKVERKEHVVRKPVRKQVVPAATKKAEVPVPQVASTSAAPPHLSLEERLFGNRPLGDAARLVIAAEILQPPKYLRGRSRNR